MLQSDSLSTNWWHLTDWLEALFDNFLWLRIFSGCHWVSAVKNFWNKTSLRWKLGPVRWISAKNSRNSGSRPPRPRPRCRSVRGPSFKPWHIIAFVFWQVISFYNESVFLGTKTSLRVLLGTSWLANYDCNLRICLRTENKRLEVSTTLWSMNIRCWCSQKRASF